MGFIWPGLEDLYTAWGVYATGSECIFGWQDRSNAQAGIFYLGICEVSIQGRIWRSGIRATIAVCIMICLGFLWLCQDDMVIGYIYPANAKLTFNGIDMICSVSENILNGLTTQSPIRDTALARLQNNSMPWWRPSL